MAFDDVIPSFLSTGERYYDGGMFSNDLMRVGEVQEIIYPGDPRSVSKKVIEYDVWVQHRANGTAVTKMYNHCVLMNSFGGVADKLTYTLRADASASRKGQRPGVGSKVLLLCINGESHNAIIIGGIRDTGSDSDPKTKDDGHNLHFVFNGVDVTVNKDGELTLQVNGATTAEGKPDNVSDKAGTSVKIEKDGKFQVKTKDGKNSITIDTSGAITIKSDQDTTINASGNVKVKAKKATIDALAVELGGENLALPMNGLVHGSATEIITGLPYFLLGHTSTKVFGAK